MQRAAQPRPPADGPSAADPLRWTLGLRLCCQCGHLIGLTVWPWSGEAVLRTHGYCEPCTARLLE